MNNIGIWKCLIELYAKVGRYRGIYTHKDIAFNFGFPNKKVFYFTTNSIKHIHVNIEDPIYNDICLCRKKKYTNVWSDLLYRIITILE